MIMKGTNIKPHLISEITKTCSANCDLSTKFNNSQRQNEDSLPAAFFYTGVGLVWSISCAAIHDRFTKVVFVVNLCRIFPCRKRNCRWTYCAAVVSVVNENCAHVFAAQEKELPHRKKNCRWTTAKVSLLGWIIFPMMDFSQLIIRHCDTIESQPGDELQPPFSKSYVAR